MEKEQGGLGGKGSHSLSLSFPGKITGEKINVLHASFFPAEGEGETCRVYSLSLSTEQWTSCVFSLCSSSIVPM